MEPKFQTSFIPKKPIVTGMAGASTAPLQTKGSTNIFSVIATILFVLTIAASGGLFVYKKILTSEVDQANKDLVAAREAFKPETIQSLIDASSRIASTKQLLQKHVAISSLFNSLSQYTVQKVRFVDFTYMDKDSVPTISMSAEAQSYNALADQMKIFSENSFVQNPNFSTFDLADNGNVSVKFTAVIDPSLVSYAKAIQSLPTTQ